MEPIRYVRWLAIIASAVAIILGIIYPRECMVSVDNAKVVVSPDVSATGGDGQADR